MISVEPAELEDAARLRNPDLPSLAHRNMDVIPWDSRLCLGTRSACTNSGPIASRSGH